MNNADEIYGTLLNTPLDPDKFGGGGGGSVSDEKIVAAVEEYMAENPVKCDGKSPYDIAVEQGFEGDEAAWLASLKGADGVGIASIFAIEDTTGDKEPATVVTITRTDKHQITFRIPHGKDGERGKSDVHIGSGEMPEGCSVQIDLGGEVITEAYFMEMIAQAISAYDAEAMALLGGDSE